MEHKKILRSKILQMRNKLSENYVENKSNIIIGKIIEIIEKNNFKNIMIYMDMKNEVKITNLLNYYEDKQFYIPKISHKGIIKINKYEEEKLEKHRFGNLESNSLEYVDENLIDLVIIPGVVYDESKNRIGFGGGYYDRFLKKIRKNNKTLILAVAYEFQVLEKIPWEEHDEKPDFLITEERIL